MFDQLNAAASEMTTIGILIRLAVATMAGVLVGMEREAKNKSAGIKTHVLVCVGAALCMMVGQYTYLLIPESADITRIGSGVVSGVGFLGVGTIIVTGTKEVRGLTTAAGIWACACIGLAAGIGYIEGAIFALIFVMFTLLVLRYIDQGLSKVSKDFDLYVEIDENHNVKHFLHEMRRMNVNYSSVRFIKSTAPGDGFVFNDSATTEKVGQKEDVLETLRDLDYVRYLETI